MELEQKNIQNTSPSSRWSFSLNPFQNSAKNSPNSEGQQKHSPLSKLWSTATKLPTMMPKIVSDQRIAISSEETTLKAIPAKFQETKQDAATPTPSKGINTLSQNDGTKEQISSSKTLEIATNNAVKTKMQNKICLESSSARKLPLAGKKRLTNQTLIGNKALVSTPESSKKPQKATKTSKLIAEGMKVQTNAAPVESITPNASRSQIANASASQVANVKTGAVGTIPSTDVESVAPNLLEEIEIPPKIGPRIITNEELIEKNSGSLADVPTLPTGQSKKFTKAHNQALHVNEERVKSKRNETASKGGSIKGLGISKVDSQSKFSQEKEPDQVPLNESKTVGSSIKTSNPSNKARDREPSKQGKSKIKFQNMKSDSCLIKNLMLITSKSNILGQSEMVPMTSQSTAELNQAKPSLSKNSADKHLETRSTLIGKKSSSATSAPLKKKKKPKAINKSEAIDSEEKQEKAIKNNASSNQTKNDTVASPDVITSSTHSAGKWKPIELNKNDVFKVFGAHSMCKWRDTHPGNVQYKSICISIEESYYEKEPNSDERSKIIKGVVKSIQSMDPPGRFLLMNERTKMGTPLSWVEIRTMFNSTLNNVRRKRKKNSGLTVNSSYLKQIQAFNNHPSEISKQPGGRMAKRKRQSVTFYNPTDDASNKDQGNLSAKPKKRRVSEISVQPAGKMAKRKRQSVALYDPTTGASNNIDQGDLSAKPKKRRVNLTADTPKTERPRASKKISESSGTKPKLSKKKRRRLSRKKQRRIVTNALVGFLYRSGKIRSFKKR